MSYLRTAVRWVLLALPWLVVLLCYPLLILWVLGVPGTTDAGQGAVVAVIMTALGSIAVYVVFMIVLAVLGATGLLARLSRSRIGVSKAAVIALVAFLFVQVACFALMFAIYG
jgi:hypothetical protein